MSAKPGEDQTSVIQRARVLCVSYARRARASRLRAVTLLALTPTLGPAQLARVLGRGIPAATMALKELVGLGVAVELTGADPSPLRPVRSGAGPAGAAGRPPRREASGGEPGASASGRGCGTPDGLIRQRQDPTVALRTAIRRN